MALNKVKLRFNTKSVILQDCFITHNYFIYWFQFRIAVRPYLGSDYMKEDIFLVRFLRCNDAYIIEPNMIFVLKFKVKLNMHPLFPAFS